MAIFLLVGVVVRKLVVNTFLLVGVVVRTLVVATVLLVGLGANPCNAYETGPPQRCW